MNNLLEKENKIDNQLEELSKMGQAMEIVKKVWTEIKQLREVITQSQDTAIQADKKAEKALAINETGQTYLNQTELGQTYKIIMSSKTVGNVLRLIGWAKISKSRTEPYHNVLESMKAKMLDRDYYRYHKEKFKNELENWLKEEGLYEKFDDHISIKQRQQFFKKLHEERIE